jgi:hypothetical protein
VHGECRGLGAYHRIISQELRIGVLPDHAPICITASVLLVELRLVQGVSIGGENPASVVFLVEGAGPDQRGLMWRALL